MRLSVLPFFKHNTKIAYRMFMLKQENLQQFIFIRIKLLVNTRTENYKLILPTKPTPTETFICR